MIGKIISIKEETEYYNKYILKIIHNSKYEKTKNCKLIIYIEKGEELLPGDIVKVEGEFCKPEGRRNYKGFDYKKYLKQDKIYGIIQVENVNKISEKQDFFCIIQLIRLNISKRIYKLYKDEIAGFLNGLLIGKTDGLSEEIEVDFRNSSISHVIAISGMHVSYVILGLNLVLEKIIKNKKIRNYLLIILLFIFSLLSGFSESCIRSCIMTSMIFFASNLHRKNNFYISFVFSLVIIIFINPYNIFNTGMWLSYSGTLGIVLFYKLLSNLINHKSRNIHNKKIVNKDLKKARIEKRKSANKKIVTKELINKESIKNKVISFFIDNFCVTISAQILILPIMVYVFNTVSLTFFISNILISFFVGPVLIAGYVSVLLSYVFIPISKVIVIFEEYFVWIILLIAKLCSKLPFSNIYVITPNFTLVIVYYVVIAIIVLCFNKKKYYVLKLIVSYKFLVKEIEKVKNKILKKYSNIENEIIKKQLTINQINSYQIGYYKEGILKRENKNKTKSKNKIIKILLIIFCIFLLINLYKNYSENLKIYFVDVGQGDCTFIQTPKGKNILIDGGEGNTDKYDYGEKVLLPYLLDRGVTKIDYLIASHADSDHIGGLFAVLENIKVDKILIGIQPEDSEQFRDLIKIANKNKIKIITLKAGDKINIEKNICLEILWPIKEKLIEENALNNNSLVFKLLFNNFSILFTGDIEKIAEKQIVEVYKENLKCDILKVAHHGSKTSSIREFLEYSKPKLALIGVGKDNKFGHPHLEVIKRLENMRVKIYRTDLNGEIEILIKDKELKMYTKKVSSF